MTETVTLGALYKELCDYPSDIVDHLPTLYQLAQDATRIVELGTRAGVSTVAFLHGLEAHGHLWSVDLGDRPDIGEIGHWTYIQGDDVSPEVFTQLPGDADVVFIDTIHTYRHTLQELNLYKWLVRPGGKIVLHDTELEQLLEPPFEKGFPVKRAIEEFCAAEGLEWTNTPECYGLGIIAIP